MSKMLTPLGSKYLCKLCKRSTEDPVAHAMIHNSGECGSCMSSLSAFGDPSKHFDSNEHKMTIALREAYTYGTVGPCLRQRKYRKGEKIHGSDVYYPPDIYRQSRQWAEGLMGYHYQDKLGGLVLREGGLNPYAAEFVPGVASAEIEKLILDITASVMEDPGKEMLDQFHPDDPQKYLCNVLEA